MKGRFEELFFSDKEEYAIVIVFFDWIIRRSDFKEILSTLAKDTGFGSEVLGCNLPSLFENKEDGYFDDRVEFYLNDDDIKIDFSMYVKCLELACKIYIEENREEEEIKNCFLSIKKSIKKCDIKLFKLKNNV